MTFSDKDSAEIRLGKSVQDMTDLQLVSYIKTQLKELQSLDLPVSGGRERAIMASLRRTYGPDAAAIIKWAFFRHKGRLSDGSPLTYTTFAKGGKWRTDMWHLELQQYRQQGAANTAASQGFSNLMDL